MILSLFRRRSSQALVERLYLQIVAAARQPGFFRAPYDIADTLEGRFELLTLYSFLVLRRLSALPPPAPDLAQDLTNQIFAGFDAALREMGVGDLTVPKRMKRLAGDFGGRSTAYARALDGVEPLEAVLARNVFGSSVSQGAVALAQWTWAADAALAKAALVDFETQLPIMPGPQLASALFSKVSQ